MPLFTPNPRRFLIHAAQPVRAAPFERPQHLPYNHRVILLALDASVVLRLGLILVVALAAHSAVLLVHASSGWLLGSRLGSITKARTFTRFLASVAVFVIWFIAVGFALAELNVPLQTYLASATIIGLAVSFGSQSLVQDVISGLTLIFAGLIDVGDMVDIAGQTGIVEKVGIRYTELRNVQGAVISIPNRNVGNVISYRLGYIRAFVDVRLPADRQHRGQAPALLEQIADDAFRQFSGVMIKAPTLAGGHEPDASTDTSATGHPDASTAGYIRIKFRIWPGQGGIIETAVRQRIISTIRTLDPSYQDWMVAVHYRVEPAFQRRAASAFELFRQRRTRIQNPNRSSP